MATLDELLDAEAARTDVGFLPVGQTGNLGQGEHDVVFAPHGGHHRVLCHLDYGLAVKEGRLWAKEFPNDVQEAWFSGERGRCKDIEPDRGLDDEAKALGAAKENLVWTSEARIVEDGEGIIAGRIEKSLPLTLAPAEEKVGDDAEACEGITLCQGTLEGDHLHAA